MYSHVQSENEHEIKQYLVHELSVVESIPMVWNHVYYPYK